MPIKEISKQMNVTCTHTHTKKKKKTGELSKKRKSDASV